MTTKEQFEAEMIKNMVNQLGFYRGFYFIMSGDAGDMIDEIMGDEDYINIRLTD